MLKRTMIIAVSILLCLANVYSYAETSYDELQTLFLNIDFESPYDDVKQMISETGLPFTEQTYNSSKGLGKQIVLCVAFTEEASLQKYADSGDYLEIAFQKNSGKLMTMEYVPEFGDSSALLYSFGVWWSFSEVEPSNDYSGYYVNAHADTEKGGIVIYSKNGNSKNTSYYRYDDKETVLNNVIEGIKQN